jgi:hypothetical protein
MWESPHTVDCIPSYLVQQLDVTCFSLRIWRHVLPEAEPTAPAGSHGR